MTDLLREISGNEERIRGFFRREQLRSDVIDDLTQEVLCRLFESAGRFRGESSPGTWIYGYCRNVLYEYFRRERKFLPLEIDPVSSAPDPWDLAVLRSREEKLPSRLRQIYEKKYRQGKKIREIAAELSLPEGSVKYYLYEIRKRMRD